MINLHTNHGVISIELDAAKAPVTAENFLGYVKSGHYDNTIFHRVIPGFMIQGGGFDAQLRERSTRAPIAAASADSLEAPAPGVALAPPAASAAASAAAFAASAAAAAVAGSSWAPARSASRART